MPRPLILFGAFDRHNFGDLLLAEVAAALNPGRALIHAGLAARDLRTEGGHAVQALSVVLDSAPAAAHDLLHVGGETLTTTAWEAAVMLQPQQQVPALLAYLQDRPAERAAWLRQTLGTQEAVPYLADRRRWPTLRRVAAWGLGGVALPQAPATVRAEVQAKLRALDAVAVRDHLTQAALQDAGLAAALLPDPTVLVPALFGQRLQAHAACGEVAALRAQWPAGYLAVQCGAEFDDDATLAALARQLTLALQDTGLGVALFRAGAAPWHDSLALLHRLAQQLPAGRVRVFGSLHLWDIAALLAASAGCVASSLHARIVAAACGLPAVSLRSPQASAQRDKTWAWVQSWQADEPGSVCGADGVAAALQQALALPARKRQALAARLAQQCRQGYAAIQAALDAA